MVRELIIEYLKHYFVLASCFLSDSDQLEGFPGERMMLRVFAYDELNETTSATIRITDEAFNAGLGNTVSYCVSIHPNPSYPFSRFRSLNSKPYL